MSSPDKRNLTDELQSVLRAHALDAPEPTESIEQVLARTVGSTEAAIAVPAPRWFARRRLVLVGAAAAAVLAAGIAVPAVLVHHAARVSTASEKAADASRTNGSLQSTPSSGTFGAAGGSANAAAGQAPLAAAPAAPPACTASDLSVSLVTSDVRAPSVAAIRVTNLSSRSCLISGFPAVEPMGPTVNSLSLATPGATAEAVPTLVLAPGTSASASVDAAASQTADMSYGSQSCDVTSLLVTMPSGAKAQFPFHSSQCAFSVHPLQPEQK